jgi:hypothetical protein
VARLIRKYWAELLVFGAIAGVLLMNCIPDITWMNTDCDGPHYIYSAKYLYPAHKTSAPLFLLLGHLFLKLPVGLDAWRFALLSVMATTVAVVFIYLIVKGKTSNKWYGMIASLVYGSSALVISQSIIIETYALVTMFGVIAYYFAEKKRWLWCAVMLGAGGAVHHLIGIEILALLIFNKELRSWKPMLIMASFLLFYLYIPITNRPPYMWQSEPGQLGAGFIADNLSTLLMLWGGLSIWDLPKRILDTIGVLGVSLMLAIIPIAIMLKQWKRPLFWMFVLPIIYYATNLAPQTYVYMMPSIAAGAILAGEGLQKLNRKWVLAVAGISIVMLGFNANYFDVGRTLDTNMSARQFYNELDKVPDGQILMAQQGWEWAIVYPYNKEEGRGIIPVCTGTLASKQYQDTLHGMGVKFDVPKEKVTLVALQNYIIQSIIDNNENVWATLPTDTRTYGAMVTRVEGHEQELDQSPQGITDGSVGMVWQWKPSNPYDIITGAIEVDEWVYIVFSNYSVLTFVMLGTIGLVPVWIGWMVFIKKKRWSLRKCKEVIRNEV